MNEIDPDIVDFYATMEVPDSIPVAGWSIMIKNISEIGLGYIQYKTGLRSKIREVVLTDDAKEWLDMTIIDPYWCLGEGSDISNYRHGDSAEFYFTTERDYILFKMRWG